MDFQQKKYVKTETESTETDVKNVKNILEFSTYDENVENF